MPEAAGEPHGTVASCSARRGRLRRNAVSPHRVRLSSAPGAPLCNGCSSANRASAGKLLWDGIIAVPEVFGAGCLALSPVRRVRAARPSGRFPTHPPGLRTHGDARRNANRCCNRPYLTAVQSSAHQLWPRCRCTGSTGLAGSPRRPRNHGRTISERHNRNPQRRANRV